jgi:hypothetical protein
LIIGLIVRTGSFIIISRVSFRCLITRSLIIFSSLVVSLISGIISLILCLIVHWSAWIASGLRVKENLDSLGRLPRLISQSDRLLSSADFLIVVLDNLC